MSGGSIVPTRLGAALALLTVGGLLAVVQIIVSAGSTGRARPAPAHERHLGLDAAERTTTVALQMTPSSVIDHQDLSPTAAPPPADRAASTPPPAAPQPSLLTAARTTSDAATPPNGTQSLSLGADARDANVPVGSTVVYTRLFDRQFHQSDSGIDCLDLRPNDIARACADACSAETECRYFYAGDAGRCCLKSDYDATSPMLTKMQGDFYELQQREPAPPSPPPPPPPLSEATMAQAASGRCLPTPSNADQTYTIVRAGVASNDPTTAPTGPVGSSCSDDRRGFVAMVTPCTSRKANFRTVARSPFAKSFLPSAVETLARSVDAGLDVVFYVGYDAGDRVWDTDTARTDTLKLAQKLFDGPTARLLPATISVGFRMVRCNSNNMVAASNCAVEAAYNDGASYWYRLNDDTTMVTPNWLRDMPAALAGFSPPNIGIVGPICKQGNTAILTYDFVHRSHWEIFRYQYPKTIQNWWCDNWVSTVYGPARTLRHPSQEVRHLLTGTRYNVYRSDPQTHKSVPDSLLPAALNEGACAIDAYLDKLLGGGGATEVGHTRQVSGAPVMTGKPTSRATVICQPN